MPTIPASGKKKKNGQLCAKNKLVLGLSPRHTVLSTGPCYETEQWHCTRPEQKKFTQFTHADHYVAENRESSLYKASTEVVFIQQQDQCDREFR